MKPTQFWYYYANIFDIAVIIWRFTLSETYEKQLMSFSYLQ